MISSFGRFRDAQNRWRYEAFQLVTGQFEFQFSRAKRNAPPELIPLLDTFGCSCREAFKSEIKRIYGLEVA